MIHDISPLIDSKIAVWPGDSPFAAEDLMRIEEGASVFLSTIRLSCHTGAHADAPSHYLAGAPNIDEAPLETFIGECVLIDVSPSDHAIRPEDVEGKELAPRVLFRTGCMENRTVFPEPLTCLTTELIDHLAARDVLLIGLDSPSVDRFDSKELPCHKALFKKRIANLEGLELAGVPQGRYELIALPLKLKGRDASPVRAILRTLE